MQSNFFSWIWQRSIWRSSIGDFGPSFSSPICFLPPSQHSLENFGGGSKARVPSLDCQSEQKWEVLLLHQHHHVELLREVKLHVRLLNLCSWWSQGRWSGSLDMMQKGIVDPHIHDDVNDMMSITLQRKLIGTISNITARLLSLVSMKLSPLKTWLPFRQ